MLMSDNFSDIIFINSEIQAGLGNTCTYTQLIFQFIFITRASCGSSGSDFRKLRRANLYGRVPCFLRKLSKQGK